MSFTPNGRRHANMNAAEEDRYDSSYFVPNLPFKEPIFSVPPVPVLTKVPPPTIRKPPVQGFDMRTLRKQVEMLNGEIEVKEETQTLLYSQNEQLWAYIQQLMQANKSNAQVMRAEVLKLHAELKTAHMERHNIAEKLQLARNSKQMLQELNMELQGAQLTVEEIARRKREAEDALLHAKEENSHLEEVLRSQVEHIQGVNLELDEYRRRRLEEQSLDLADDFFYTNKTILRAAYYRFRSGVQKRFKLNRIAQAVKSVFSVHIKTYYFASWCKFMHRKRVMYRNQAHRRAERLALCVQQWKVFAALEKFFKRSRRKQLLKRIFTAWRTDARESAYEKWAQQATLELHTLQFKRKMFHGWRRRTMFLSWNNPMIHLLEQEAQLHFLRRTVRAWARVSRVLKEEMVLKIREVPRIVQWWHLTRWRELCETRWRRRGRLLRRFFRNLRCKVVERSEDAVTIRYAYSAWVSYKQRKALKKWLTHLRTRRMYITVPGAVTFAPQEMHDRFADTLRSSASEGLFIDTARSVSHVSSPTALAGHFDTPHSRAALYTHTSELTSATAAVGYSQPLLGALVGSLGHALESGLIGGKKISKHRRLRPYSRWQQNRTIQVLSHMKLRWLRGCMFQWVVKSAVLRRQRLCLQAGMQHHASCTASAAVRRWREVVRRHVDRRVEKRMFVFQKIVSGWKAFTAECKADRRLQQGLQDLEHRVKARLQSHSILRWQQSVRDKKRQAHCEQYLRWLKQRRTLQATFSAWRCKFTQQLFWKLRELSIEHSRAKELDALHQQEIAELTAEQQRAAQAAAILEQGVVALQEALTDANLSNEEQLKAIQAKETEKAEILVALEATQQGLRDAISEQEQMRAFEEVLLSELQVKEAERGHMRQVAAQAVARVNAHADSLRDEVATAREHAMFVERAADAEILRGQQEVESVQRQADSMQQQLLEKRRVLLTLESEHSGLMVGLSKVQSKLSDVARDGAALIAENEALIRSKGSAVRILKSNVGLKEARVGELNNLIAEFEQERGRAQLHSVLQEDDSELRELIAMQRQIEAGAYRTGAAASSPTAGKGVSLYHNVLSPAVGANTPSAHGTSAAGPGARRSADKASNAGSTPAAGRGVSGPGVRRSLRVDAPSSLPAAHRNSVGAPTPPILTPHSQTSERILAMVQSDPTARPPRKEDSIFELIPPRKLSGAPAAPINTSAPARTSSGRDPWQDFETSHGPAGSRKVPSPRVHPLPAPRSPTNKLVNNFVGAAPAGVDAQLPNVLRMSFENTGNAGANTWSTTGSANDGGRFTPPISPSRSGLPRSPTFLTAALDTDTESEGAPAPHAASHRTTSGDGHAGHHDELSLRSGSPASEAQSEHAPISPADVPYTSTAFGRDHYYHEMIEEEEESGDEGSSFDGHGGGGAEQMVNEDEFHDDTASERSF